jgi:hypothetical protein
MNDFPSDRSADERWIPYALIQVNEIVSSKKPFEQIYEDELAAISQAIPESQDSLDTWHRLAYDPASNLVLQLSSFDNSSKFFVSGDHVLLYLPLSADWVQMEYLDLIEFQLNILVITTRYLNDLSKEIRQLYQTHLVLKSPKITPDMLKRFNEQRLEDIERINSLKSQLITMRNLANASQVTVFVEHRAILEGVSKAINLNGAIQQAENLAGTLMDIEESWDYIGRLIYQDRMDKLEQRRARVDEWLTFFLQLIGVTSVVSALISIVIVSDTDHFTIPWWFSANSVWTIAGAQLKVISELALAGGFLIILLAWFIFARRPKHP